MTLVVCGEDENDDVDEDEDEDDNDDDSGFGSFDIVLLPFALSVLPPLVVCISGDDVTFVPFSQPLT